MVKKIRMYLTPVRTSTNLIVQTSADQPMGTKDAVRTNFVLFKFISVSCSYTEYTLVL